ncbi:MAG TPA: hypothetical protein PKE51_05600, partial [Gemmatimonadaceae bacterium]|nr:hypothetical protein [Gemmatimonadaceae bacterium]
RTLLRERVERDRALRSVDVIGPAPCAIHRIKDRWRWHFFVRTTEAGALSRLCRYVAARSPATARADVRLVVDRDPVALL